MSKIVEVRLDDLLWLCCAAFAFGVAVASLVVVLWKTRAR